MGQQKILTGRLFILFSLFFLVNSHAQNSANIGGKWQGKSSPQDNSLLFTIQFEKAGNGYRATYSSDEQRALDIPLQNVKFDSLQNIVTFALLGDVDSWLFEGKIRDSLFTGTITKGNKKAGFILIKENEEPFPYHLQDVQFMNDTVRLAGTLYVPISSQQVPAIIFLHGSGSESRFASAYYADYFARRGIAVLIYDKRGVGKSTGNWRTSSFIDLARDAIAGIKLLEESKKIDAKNIGVYGHSQGGSICPMVLNMHPRLSFGISSGSAGVSMEESDWYEVQNRFKNYVSGKDYENAMAVMHPYLKFASTGKGYPELLAQAKKYEQQPWFKDYIGDIDSSAFFFRYYRLVGSYNPVEHWKKVKQPALILKGATDQTSPGYPSFQNIENALKEANHRKHTIILLPNTTHEMHVAGKPTDFWFKATPGYPGMIYKWIKETILGH